MVVGTLKISLDRLNYTPSGKKGLAPRLARSSGVAKAGPGRARARPIRMTWLRYWRGEGGERAPGSVRS